QDAGLELAEWSPATATSLTQLSPSFAAVDNPLDLGTAAFTKPEMMNRAAQLMIDDAGVNSLIVTLFPGRPAQQMEKAEQLLPVIRGTDKPVAFVMLGDPMPLDANFMTMVRAEGAALFRSTERAVRAMATVSGVARTLACEATSAADGVGAHKPLELSAFQAGRIPEYRAKALLAAMGVPVPEGALAQDLPAAEAVAAR